MKFGLTEIDFCVKTLISYDVSIHHAQVLIGFTYEEGVQMMYWHLRSYLMVRLRGYKEI